MLDTDLHHGVEKTRFAQVAQALYTKHETVIGLFDLMSKFKVQTNSTLTLGSAISLL